MASIVLPASPAPRVLGWEPVDFGGVQKGILGGAATRVNRLGRRWRVKVELPPMTNKDARYWAADLSEGLEFGVRLALPQPSLAVGYPGSVLVNGASQTGRSITLDGFTAQYAWRKGQWLSIETGSRLYLYQVTEAGIASSSGDGSVSITPALRVSPTDNDTVHFGAPSIEGFIDAAAWQLTPDRLVHGVQFTIEEFR